MRTAVVSSTTIAIEGSGHGFKLEPGEYTVAELDGVSDADGVAYVHGPNNGDLVCISLHDPKITINQG